MLSKACIVGTYQRKLEEMVNVAPDLSLTVVVPAFWKDERGTTRLERAHTEGYRLDVQPIAFNGAFHLHFYPQLGRALAAYQPDLVHIDEEPYNFATYHAHRLARRAGAKTLWFSWQNLQRRYPPPFSWFERYNVRHVDHALVGSHTAGAVWRAKGYHGPLTVVPQFGVDPEQFHPGERNHAAPPEPVHIAYVGRLVPEKGVDLFIEALGELTGDWRATLVGSGPEESRLRAQIEDLGLENRADFEAWRPSTAMPDFYRDVDVLVLPSRTQPNWTEQFGRVLIEAMACGAVVVGSDAGEIPHVIGDAGCTFPEGEVKALRDALAALIRHPDRRRALSARGRARVQTHFTQHHIAATTVEVYRDIVHSSNG
jgi:glycosyltransferase involved in cell wall biosynthesis